MWFFEHHRLSELLAALQEQGYKVIGPRKRDHAIVYEPISSVEDLPQGWTDEQEAGHYRLKQRDDNAFFGYNVGPQTWKKEFLPARRKLWEVTPTAHGVEWKSPPLPEERLAFLGVRSCELHAIEIQDEILHHGDYPDPFYKHQRDGAFLIVVQCTQAGATCFCTSMNTGPHADKGYDLALTEVLDGDSSWFLLDTGSERGQEIVDSLQLQEASEEQCSTARNKVDEAAQQMGRQLNTDGLAQLLDEQRSHNYWQEIGERCLGCANCTMVCPTCFCTNVEDHTELGSDTAERWRRWDSCFHEDFSYLAGGPIRQSIASRYRQWMTHKLSSWVEQFGSFGCVGCGRCIAWCPVGIDITAEATVFQQLPTESSQKA